MKPFLESVRRLEGIYDSLTAVSSRRGLDGVTGVDDGGYFNRRVKDDRRARMQTFSGHGHRFSVRFHGSRGKNKARREDFVIEVGQ